MIYELRLIKNHYTRDYLQKDIFTFCFSLVVDFILTFGSLWLIGMFITWKELYMIVSFIIYIVFLIFPFVMLYYSIDTNVKDIKWRLKK